MSFQGLMHVTVNIIFQSKLLDSSIKTRMTESIFGKIKNFHKIFYEI